MPKIKFKDREIVKRWKAESPEFFVNLQTIGARLTALGLLLCIFPPMIPVGAVIGSVGTTIATVSKLTKKDATKEDVDKLKAELELLKAKLN